MNKFFLWALLLQCFMVNLYGQGIRWTTGLSWEEVKQKAKAENKYVFIDAYTTWCGPCKTMDMQVYPNDSVGSYFNDRFLSIKVQMDKTGKDNDTIKKWYAIADSMIILYKIEGYPSFIFLSPEGILTHKDIGLKTPDSLIATAQIATIPGRVYDDGYAEYDKLMVAYRQGIKDNSRYPFMINMALKHQDQQTAFTLLKELTDSVSKLPPSQRYTKEIIQVWSLFMLRTDRPVFRFFLNDGKLIDKVMDEQNYAASIVDKSVQNFHAMPFLLEQAKGSSVSMTGMYMMGPGLKADTSEADWKQLEGLLSKQFSPAVTTRNVLAAKVEWYKRHYNFSAAAKAALELYHQFPPHLRSPMQAYNVNNNAFTAFIYSTDQKLLKGYVALMEKLVKVPPASSSRIDTYANLLYKTGRKKDAIAWEQKAVKLAPADPNLAQTLQLMKAGKQTYPGEGVIWK